MNDLNTVAPADALDALDKRIINTLQRSFPVCDHPFAVVAEELGTTESELISRLQRLREGKILSRFGPSITLTVLTVRSVCVPLRCLRNASMKWLNRLMPFLRWHTIMNGIMN
ncbi:Lrp/AsnC family transcriptional regulator [Aliamphritea spongicola]|nr:Lrp/AsnC family transcriptional regulator [Aliamphritea spongicola]